MTKKHSMPKQPPIRTWNELVKAVAVSLHTETRKDAKKGTAQCN